MTTRPLVRPRGLWRPALVRPSSQRWLRLDWPQTAASARVLPGSGRAQLQPCAGRAALSTAAPVEPASKVPSEYTALPRTVGDLLAAGADLVGSKVVVHGWVRTVRRQKRIAFAAVSDGSTSQAAQIVFLQPELAQGLSMGASVRIAGSWVASTGAGQSYELQAETVDVLGECDPETFPLQKKFQNMETMRRTVPALRWRSMQMSSILQMRSSAMAGLTNYFNSADFVQTSPPVITGSDCEGAGEVFEVTTSEDRARPAADDELFFGKQTYLTVSTQLHLEALAMAVSRVWTLAPTFRAEKSLTNRHLSEFWMLEAEMAFTEDLDSVLTVAESMIKSTVGYMRETGAADRFFETRALVDKLNKGDHAAREDIDTAELRARWDVLSSPERWPQITFHDAVDVLQQAVADGKVEFPVPPRHNEAIGSKHEKWLAKHWAKGPVFVTHYPAHLKPFYMLPTAAPGRQYENTVECFDLLLPDLGELIGGSLRESDAGRLEEAVAAAGIRPDDISWYIDLRRWGTVPHGGFGMGFERLLCYLAGVENVREVIAFPRWTQHCVC
ncbi:uncharacterized protein V1510DRAFT_421360 [Dipodascopsis tothii]|uniref:uncharacterized protein n=1 Tax=Dipodascopsis tothii TaxID=44089 RepID=UPI0034CF698A